MPVDMTEFEALSRRAEAMNAEDAAIQREFTALIARWMEGTPDERAAARSALAAWADGARSSIKQGQSEVEMAQNWLVGS